MSLPTTWEDRALVIRNKTQMKNYVIVIRPDSNGTSVAYIPAIPGCHAMGDTPQLAFANLFGVFEMIKEEYAQDGKLLPPETEPSGLVDKTV